jgi:hypothetical protein
MTLMKLNLETGDYPFDVLNAYYETCAWNLERVEILTDKVLPVPLGRGQIISQFIAFLGRSYSSYLPKPIVPVVETFAVTQPTGDLAEGLAFQGAMRIPHYSVKSVGTFQHWEAVKGPTKQPAVQQPVQLPVQLPAKQPVPPPVQQPVKPVQQPVQKPIQQPVKPIQKPTPKVTPKPILRTPQEQPRFEAMRGTVQFAFANGHGKPIVVNPPKRQPTSRSISTVKHHMAVMNGQDQAPTTNQPKMPLVQLVLPTNNRVNFKVSTVNHHMAVQTGSGRPPAEGGIGSIQHANSVQLRPGRGSSSGSGSSSGRGSSSGSAGPGPRVIIPGSGGISAGSVAGEFVTGSGTVIWVPTVETMRDWADFLIYISNQYTFFKDLCIKHNNIANAQAAFKTSIMDAANKGLFPKYSFWNRMVIKIFTDLAVGEIITKFTELYNDPYNTCSCADILRIVPSSPVNDAAKAKLNKVMADTCKAVKK